MINNKNDIEALPGADDSYSDAVFSPVNDLIAATSWDGHVFFCFYDFSCVYGM